MDVAWPNEAPRSAMQYQIERLLAVGGMAEVYVAIARAVGGFEKRVVLKRLLPAYAADPELVRGFVEEACVAARLSHPNIPHVYDLVERDGHYFFTMELLEGLDASELIARAARARRPIPVQHAVHIGVGIAAALHHAHDLTAANGAPLRLIHRDVSPANVFATLEGRVKLLDFGVAKSVLSSVTTQVGFVKGKLPYMSPEQCLQGPLDRRTDVFSLGAVLYELTTGTPLVSHDLDDEELMHRIVGGGFARPSAAIPGYPDELERIVMTALAPAPERRFQTALELQRELESFAATHGLDLGPAALAAYVGALADRPAHLEPMVADEPTVIETREPDMVFEPVARAISGAHEPDTVVMPAELVSAWRDRLEDADPEVTAIYGATEVAVARRERSEARRLLAVADQPTVILPQPVRTVVPAPRARPSLRRSAVGAMALWAVLAVCALATAILYGAAR